MARRPSAAAAAAASTVSSDIAAPAVRTPPQTGRTVTVACKFPAGIRLQLCTEVKFVEETMAGGRIQRTRYDKVGETYIVRGPSTPNGQTPKGYKRPEVEGGYALTSNIPADFWEKWLHQNAENPLVTGKMIFASPTRDHAIGESQELEGTRSGFEPLDPDNADPRIPRSLDPNVSNIETAEVG